MFFFNGCCEYCQQFWPPLRSHSVSGTGCALCKRAVCRRVVPAPSESGAMVPVEDNRPPAPDGPDKPRWDRQTSELKLDSIFRCILKKILGRSSKLASRCRSRALFQIVILKFLFIYQGHEISLGCQRPSSPATLPLTPHCHRRGQAWFPVALPP